VAVNCIPPWSTDLISLLRLKYAKKEYGHGDIDPVIVKKMYVHERLAEEMKQSEIDCEALPLGSHPI
jgi:hypothetical protein